MGSDSVHVEAHPRACEFKERRDGNQDRAASCKTERRYLDCSVDWTRRVGHTDNVGAFDYNVGLSERRAAAVVKALTTTHGIAAARLQPAGVGMPAPVGPNDNEDGRAKNRRVELVKQ